LFAHGRWFYPGTPVSFTTKTGHHDIAEILLKNGLKYQKIKNQVKLFILKDDCELRGSDLITVNGPVENVWLQTLMKGN
jgi:hypothetical protein